MAKPNLPDIQTLLQAGIDPKTGLPIRMDVGDATKIKSGVKAFLRIIDEQDAVNRGKWFNLPCNITGQELERMLYYRGQLAFFYFKELDEFYFMPYALDGTIDFYGRFNTIHPLPFTNGTTEDKNKNSEPLTALLSQKRLNCVYGVITDEDQITPELLENSCVLLHDYTKQLSQTIIARQIINEPILDVMANIIPYVNTNLLMNSGVKGMRVQDADQYANVLQAGQLFQKSALEGKPFTPVVGMQEFQELGNVAQGKASEYFMALQSLDNLRLSGYGLENGGLFEKKAHILEEEAALNSGSTGLVLQDAVSIRQNFCNIVNSIWNLGIWYEPSENVVGDIDGDAVAYDRNEENEASGMEVNSNANDTNV